MRDGPIFEYFVLTIGNRERKDKSCLMLQLSNKIPLETASRMNDFARYPLGIVAC
ncbi:hypothetical protein J31TS4_25980 [Paenibacillus sp. J31TS4]|nr:hypothetical protein J31TS4_25980 [Paenibacillus sp. J31TS4]